MYSYKKMKDLHKSRTTGVGASDIPTLALMRVKWGQTPYQLWKVKTGREKPFSGNRFTWWGNQLEGLILREFISKYRDNETAFKFYTEYLRNRSYKEFKVKTEFRHPEYRFALSHPDLLVESDEETIQEAKSHSFFAARREDDNPDLGYSTDDFGQDGIPIDEFLQVQWQLFTSGIQTGGLSVLINTNDYREYGPIFSDPRTQEKCLALAERFWWHVEHDEPPKPETWADVQDIFPSPKETTAMVSGEDELVARKMVAQWHKTGKAIKRLSAKRDDIKNALGLMIGENKVLSTPEGVKLASSWTQKNPASIDIKRVEAEFPEVYAAMWENKVISQTKRRELRPAKLKG
jgi:predicted phage-related endonuclease